MIRSRRNFLKLSAAGLSAAALLAAPRKPAAPNARPAPANAANGPQMRLLSLVEPRGGTLTPVREVEESFSVPGLEMPAVLSRYNRAAGRAFSWVHLPGAFRLVRIKAIRRPDDSNVWEVTHFYREAPV